MQQILKAGESAPNGLSVSNDCTLFPSPLAPPPPNASASPSGAKLSLLAALVVGPSGLSRGIGGGPSSSPAAEPVFMSGMLVDPVVVLVFLADACGAGEALPAVAGEAAA